MKKANKRGVTLIELICVLAVVAILGTLVGGFITMAGAEYTNAALHMRAKSNVTLIQKSLEADLRYVENAVLSNNIWSAPEKTSRVIYSNQYNGRIYTNDGQNAAVDYFASIPDFYDIFLYQIDFSEDKGGLSAKITAYTQKNGLRDKKMYSAKWTLNFLNTTLAPASNPIAIWYQPLKK